MVAKISVLVFRIKKRTSKMVVLSINYEEYSLNYFGFLYKGTEEHASPYMRLLATGCNLFAASR